MKNVIVETRLNINLTREQWQLYDSATGNDLAVINSNVEHAINYAKTATDAYREGCKILDLFSKVGASDTEPRAVLEELIRLRFPY